VIDQQINIYTIYFDIIIILILSKIINRYQFKKQIGLSPCHSYTLTNSIRIREKLQKLKDTMKTLRTDKDTKKIYER